MILTTKLLSGIYPAFPTPTGKDGRLNANTLQKLVDHLLIGGASGLVPVGGTGEFSALSPLARREVVEITVSAARNTVPVVAGILSPGLAEAIEAGKSFKAAGANGLLLVAPFYVTPTQSGIREYFKAFRDKVDLPLLLYDIPSRTKVFVQPETVARMVDDGTIIGMKACDTDTTQFNRLIDLVGNRISVMSGDDGLFPVHAALGATGGILASATLTPHFWVELLDLVRRGSLSEALTRHRAYQPLLDALFAECNPGPLKEAMRLLEFETEPVLLPLLPPSTATVEKIKRAIATLRSKKMLGEPFKVA
jgi:4-hydroxy-tetrahydrodipicolinate synthase